MLKRVCNLVKGGLEADTKCVVNLFHETNEESVRKVVCEMLNRLLHRDDMEMVGRVEIS